jgi:hypothetical protein
MSIVLKNMKADAFEDTSSDEEEHERDDLEFLQEKSIKI